MSYLMDMDIPELERLLKNMGEPSFRAKQVYSWLQRGAAIDEMSDIPKNLRAELNKLPLGSVKIFKEFKSSKTDAVKYLFLLEDGEFVEGVLMRYRHGYTMCLSTQIGCRMGCAFCASTLNGLVRNLRPGELLGQIAAAERNNRVSENQRVLTNIVLMGSGEPLDNYENVIAFLKRVISPDGLGISPRNISLSTCGLVPKIYRLMEESLPVTLCISLHAHNDALRSQLVPVNRQYPIPMVLNAVKAYIKKTGRRAIIEYALIEKLNDGPVDAASLAKLLKGINCHVNLIPLNNVPERNLKGSSRKRAMEFASWLAAEKTSATVRRSLGTDIEGACGQLRQRHLHENGG